MINKKYSVGFCRVSTIKQRQEGESLDVQKLRIKKISESLEAEVDKVFSGAYSGAKSDRNDIKSIVEYIVNSEKNIEYFIFTDIDRLTRGGSGEFQKIKAQFSKIGVQLIDANGIIQPEKNTLDYLNLDKEYDWAIESNSLIAENFKADFANDDRKKILRRLIPREVELIREGYHIGPPPDGFVNEKIVLPNGKKKVILSPDKNRSEYFIKIFKMRETSRYSDIEIVEQINSLGYKSKYKNRWVNNEDGEQTVVGKSGGNLLTVKHLQKIVQRPEYCGVKTHKWLKEPIKAKYPGLVSIKTFNKANRGKVYVKELKDNEVEVLYNHKPVRFVNPRMKDNPLFPYRKVIKCPFCEGNLKGSESTGKSGKRFPAYHCEKNHERFSLNKKEFERNVKEYISGLEFNREKYKTLKINLKKVFNERKEEIGSSNEMIENNIKVLKSEQKQIIKTLPTTESPTAKRMLEEEIENLERNIQDANKKTIEAKLGKNDFEDFLEYTEKLVEHLPDLLINTEDIIQKQALFRLVFEEPPTYDEIVSGTPNLREIFKVLNRKELSVVPRGIEPLFSG